MTLAAPAFLGSLAAPLASAVALVTVGVVALLAWRRRGVARRGVAVLEARHGVLPTLCPSCHREFPEGLVYCPIDARKLVAADDGVDRRTPGVRCPRCRRAFDATTRYCPLDAEELVPQSVWEATHPGETGEPVDDIHGDGHDPGKICPTCAAKYGLDASFCGKDGSELVTVN